jgi:hypothetical protein
MKRIDSLVRSLLVGAGILLLAGFAVPSVSQAATLTFELTSDHCSGGCLTNQTSGGTITVTDAAGGGVDLSLALSNGNRLILTGVGDPYSFLFNLSGNPSVSFTSLVGFGTVGSNPHSASSLSFDGFGPFEYGLTCGTCTGNGLSGAAAVGQAFSVHISNITTASFEPTGAENAFFGVDIYSGTTGKTGPVDASFVATPEPSTVLLYGLGLTMLIVGQKWRKSRAVSADLN